MTDTRPDVPQTTGFAAAGEAQWRALVDKSLKGGDFERRLVSRTADGIRIEPLYWARDSLAGAAGEAPGAPSFARGFVPAGTRQRWQIRQIHADSDPLRLRAALAEDFAAGADAVTIRIAGPGQTGLAADAGSIRTALAGLDLPPGSVHLAPGAAVLSDVALAAFGSALGGLGLDPVGTLARTGERTCLAAPPRWLDAPATTLLADGRHFHEAGGSEAQEIAGLLGALVFHLRAAEIAGVAPDAALPRIGLALAADADLFLTIAKLRAARQLVWRVAEVCGAGDATGALRLLVTTSERMMSRRDPWVNMLRTTAATAAAAMGGADAIGVLPFTWALGQPDSFARRIARNTHHVLAEESGLGRVADPAGGSYAVEALTAEIATTAWRIFQDWEGAGGIVAALDSGLVAGQIAAVAEARARAIATGKLALTGTSSFPQLGPDGVTAEPWPQPASCAGALLAPIRLAQPFERLRDTADSAATPPRVFLATLGPVAEHAARATWVQNLLAAGGVASVTGEGSTNSADAGRAFAESGAAVACICGTDDAYGQLGEAVAGVLKQAGSRRVYVAGRPGNAAELQAAGVDGFWFAGADMLVVLGEVLEVLRGPAS